MSDQQIVHLAQQEGLPCDPGPAQGFFLFKGISPATFACPSQALGLFKALRYNED